MTKNENLSIEITRNERDKESQREKEKERRKKTNSRHNDTRRRRRRRHRHRIRITNENERPTKRTKRIALSILRHNLKTSNFRSREPCEPNIQGHLPPHKFQRQANKVIRKILCLNNQNKK